MNVAVRRRGRRPGCLGSIDDADRHSSRNPATAGVARRGRGDGSSAAARRGGDGIGDGLALVDKLASYVSLSDAEIACLTELHEPQRKLGRHRAVIVAGRHYDQIFILCSGVVSHYKVLPDGKRQILNLGLPGDLIGVPSCLFETAVNSVSALTDAVVAPVPFPKLFSVFARYPRLGAAVFWSSACELRSTASIW